MYQALYRKWRPKVFEDVVGQAHITDTLKNQLSSGKLSHAYLFSGTRGTGKTSTAKILARAVNCLNPVNSNPCNECEACREALSGSAVDIVEMDAASNNKVEDARAIIDEVVYAPASMKKKVYIIDEAHMLTQNAFNALLKTLEEPPEHIVFIFATTEPHKFPPTILSRCQRFDFKRITPYDIEKRINFIVTQEGYEITPEACGLVAQVADGAMRDALSILDQCLSAEKKKVELEDVVSVTGVSDPNFVYDFVKALINGDLAECFLKINSAYEKGKDLEKLPDELVNAFRNLMIAKTVEDRDKLEKILGTGSTAVSFYSDTAGTLSLEKILRYIDILSSASSLNKYMNNSRLALEVAVSGVAKRPEITSPQGILERLMELENKVKNIEKGTVPAEKPIKPKKEETKAEKEEITEEFSEKAREEYREIEEEYVYENDFSDFETSDYPIASEEFASVEEPFFEEKDGKNEKNADMEKSTENDCEKELKRNWDEVFSYSATKARAGFERIIGKAQKEFSGNKIIFWFETETFCNFASENGFSDIIKSSYKAVAGIDASVHFVVGNKKTEKSEGNSNYDDLLNKLNSHRDEINFF